MPACTRSAIAMLTDFFVADDIEATARRTGFVQRTSKITGKLFLALVTFGTWSEGKTTLAQLAAKGTQLRQPVEVSPEALHQRMNKQRSEEHTSELQSPCNLVCRLLLEN